MDLVGAGVAEVRVAGGVVGDHVDGAALKGGDDLFDYLTGDDLLSLIECERFHIRQTFCDGQACYFVDVFAGYTDRQRDR